ncbi:MAG: hypothetical protein KDK08_29885 [Rhizobiaceae bacterium]|nr:hypothetical protein [Rhizobiaceae bacterium]
MLRILPPPADVVRLRTPHAIDEATTSVNIASSDHLSLIRMLARAIGCNDGDIEPAHEAKNVWMYRNRQCGVMFRVEDHELEPPMMALSDHVSLDCENEDLLRGPDSLRTLLAETALVGVGFPNATPLLRSAYHWPSGLVIHAHRYVEHGTRLCDIDDMELLGIATLLFIDAVLDLYLTYGALHGDLHFANVFLERVHDDEKASFVPIRHLTLGGHVDMAQLERYRITLIDWEFAEIFRSTPQLPYRTVDGPENAHRSFSDDMLMLGESLNEHELMLNAFMYDDQVQTIAYRIYRYLYERDPPPAIRAREVQDAVRDITSSPCY